MDPIQNSSSEYFLQVDENKNNTAGETKKRKAECLGDDRIVSAAKRVKTDAVAASHKVTQTLTLKEKRVVSIETLIHHVQLKNKPALIKHIEEKKEVLIKEFGPIFNQCTTFLSQFLYEYLTQCINEAHDHDMQTSICPTWVKKLLDYRNVLKDVTVEHDDEKIGESILAQKELSVRYAAFGALVETLSKKYPIEFQQTIEANILTILSQLLQRVKEIEKKNPHLMLDVLLGVFKRINAQLDDLILRKVQATATAQVDTSVSQEDMKLNYIKWSNDIIDITLQDAKAILVPDPLSNEYINNKILEEIRDHALPKIFQMAIEDMASDLGRNTIIVKALKTLMGSDQKELESVRNAINELPEVKNTPKYAHEEEFKTVLHDFMIKFYKFYLNKDIEFKGVFDFVFSGNKAEKAFMPTIEKYILEDIFKVFHGRSLTFYFERALMQALPKLAKDAEWVQNTATSTSASLTLQHGSFIFPRVQQLSTQDEKDECKNAKLTVEREDLLKKLPEKIHSLIGTGSGLVQGRINELVEAIPKMRNQINKRLVSDIVSMVLSKLKNK